MPRSRVKWLSFLRVLWPSWRFFDTADANAYLFYRVKQGGSEWQPWAPVPRAPTLSAMAWLWNPRGNEELAAAGVTEALLHDAQDNKGATLEQRVPYRLVLNYLKRRVPLLSERDISFQFKISYVRCDPEELIALEDAVISKTHTSGLA